MNKNNSLIEINRYLVKNFPNKVIVTLAFCAITWLYIHRFYPASPPPLGLHEGSGWWGWFDQSQYLKMTEQFLSKDFFNPDRYYPPLYPALAAISSYFVADYGYILIDISCSLVCVYAAIKIYSKQKFDCVLILLFILGAYGFKNIFLIQWIIPWTTNLSSAFIAVLAIMLNEINLKNQKVIYKYTIYSMILTTLMVTLRPFETIPCVIITFGIIKETLYLSFREITNHNKDFSKSRKKEFKASLSLLIGILLSFLIIILYAIYNQLTYDSFIFAYSKKIISSAGFTPQDFSFKFASLMNDSSFYGVTTETIKNRVPWISIMIGMTIVNTIHGKRVERYLAFAALISAASYLTFNDLVPTGIFRYYNIHYFTWSIAIFGLSSFSYCRYLIVNISQKMKYKRDSFLLFLSIALVTVISIIIFSIKPSISSNNFNIDSKQVECKMLDKNKTNIGLPLYSQENKTINTRYIVINKSIKIDPSELHVTHGNQINLKINNDKLNYYRDFRLVKAKGEDKLALLFNKSIKVDTESNLKLIIANTAGKQLKPLIEICN